MRIAITREISRQIGRCEPSYQERRPIDLAVAREQHRRYEECLARLDCRLEHLPEESDLPDSVFVEDSAIVLDELAIITRPGAPSRRPETDSIAQALQPYRKLIFVEEPATLDGGDVLCFGKKLYIGRSRRSNAAGISQVRAAVSAFGYTVTGVEIRDCLHLKSAVTQVADDALLINREWTEAEAFGPARFIDVHPEEAGAANALRIGEVVILPAAYPLTAGRLRSLGINLRVLDVSELAKAEGALTCCSLIFHR